jgi:CheY-like chemotaxis protein
MRALVIDDNQEILDVLSYFFEINEIACQIVSNPEDGLSRLRRKEPYDVILLDLAMPNFSGFDVVNTMKRENLLQEYNVIIITALNLGIDEVNLLLQEGVKEIVSKPLSIQNLEEVTQKYLTNRRVGLA